MNFHYNISFPIWVHLLFKICSNIRYFNYFLISITIYRTFYIYIEYIWIPIYRRIYIMIFSMNRSLLAFIFLASIINIATPLAHCPLPNYEGSVFSSIFIIIVRSINCCISIRSNTFSLIHWNSVLWLWVTILIHKWYWCSYCSTWFWSIEFRWIVLFY